MVYSFEPCGFDSYLKRVDILLRINWNKYSICIEQSQDLGNMEKYPSNALGPPGTHFSRNAFVIAKSITLTLCKANISILQIGGGGTIELDLSTKS